MFWEWLDNQSLVKSLLVLLFAILFITLSVQLAFYIRYEFNMFSCIENGGVWLAQYQVGCTYPHG